MQVEDNIKKIQIIILDPIWTKRAHPMLNMLKGGHIVKAGEWFLEVNRILYDVYQSFRMLENFLNRQDKGIYIGDNKDKIEISDHEKMWLFGYIVDNAYLRISACLEKIAQMARVYYEYLGYKLYIYPRCGKCQPEIMADKSCTFGALLHTLHKEGGDKEIDDALFALEKSKEIAGVKKVRNDISHRINKTIFYPGLDPKVNTKIDKGIQKTTFIFGGKYKTLNDYRKIIADAHNIISSKLNVIGPKIFPEDNKINVQKKKI